MEEERGTGPPRFAAEAACDRLLEKLTFRLRCAGIKEERFGSSSRGGIPRKQRKAIDQADVLVQS
jgi:hypothetical protein